jgi:hypothetical protein
MEVVRGVRTLQQQVFGTVSEKIHSGFFCDSILRQNADWTNHLVPHRAVQSATDETGGGEQDDQESSYGAEQVFDHRI